MKKYDEQKQGFFLTHDEHEKGFPNWIRRTVTKLLLTYEQENASLKLKGRKDRVLLTYKYVKEQGFFIFCQTKVLVYQLNN